MNAGNFTRSLPAKAAQWLGPGLFVTGVLHVAFGLLISAEPLAAILDDGVFGAATADPETESWFWYMVAGPPLLLIGHLVWWTQRKTGEVPRFIAPYLAALALAALLFPAGGLWLFAVLCMAAVMANASPRTGYQKLVSSPHG